MAGDIYRIWSTDWFENADNELKKLKKHIDSRLDAFLAGQIAQDFESILLGKAVDQSKEQSAKIATLEESLANLEEESLFVEVGDTVIYYEAGNEEEIRRVSIVRGRDDPASAIINDNKPLAIALLGAEVGETVTVHLPLSELDIVVVRIERVAVEAGNLLSSKSPTLVDGVKLEPYSEWYGNAVEANTTSVEEATNTLLEIVETEGPVLESRACQTYVRASGVFRVSQQMRRGLYHLLAKLEKEKRIVVERADGENGYRNALLRTPNTESIIIREIGPRSFYEVPLSELTALIRVVRSSKPGVTDDQIYREVLAIYGLVRLTTQFKARFQEADKPINKIE